MIKFETDRPFRVDGMRILPGGRIEIVSEGAPLQHQFVTVAEHRKTAKKEKALSAITSQEATLAKLHPVDLLAEFDAVCAVDTGTKKINGEVVSFSVFAPCKIGKDGRGRNFLKAKAVEAAEFRGAVDKPENFGWLLLLEQLRCLGVLVGTKRLAVITDSDLRNHVEYNLRKKPYFKNEFLPANVHLVYATGDSGNDNVSKLIRHCDKVATELLIQAERSQHPAVDRSAPLSDEVQALRRWTLAPTSWDCWKFTNDFTNQISEALLRSAV